MNLPFSIIELSAELVKGVVEEGTKPHRQDYEEIIIVTKGKPHHLLDENKIKLTAPIAIYVALGKIHEFSPDIDTRGYAVRFTCEFVPQSNFHFYANFLEYIKYSLSEGNAAKSIESLCEMMLSEYSQPKINYGVLEHLLSALLLKLETEGKKQYGQNAVTKNADMVSFNTLLRMVEENFRQNKKGVAFYADKLNMTARSLNNITQTVLEKSVTEIIEARKLTQARQLLIHTNKSISEIGFELGYHEKSHFTRVFHNKTGLTPSDYKTKMQAMLA